jgi:lipopolysaccharide biosynthesis protein
MSLNIFRRRSANQRPIVHSNWYRLEYPDVAASGMDPAKHYEIYGRHEGRHPRFDAEWYISEYVDVANAGIDPYEHYMHHGRHEGRHPAFQVSWYLSEYPDVAASGMDPYQHYLNYGRAEGRHPAFDRRWYEQEYPEIIHAGAEPYQHYLHHGRSEGRHPAFQRLWYLAEYSDVREAGLDPFKHYMRNGRYEGRHPAFDRRWYSEEYPDIGQYGLDALDHYQRYGKFENWYPVFQRRWYYAEYRDVFEAGYDAFRHYRETGKSQGRRPAPIFSRSGPYKVPLGNFAAPYSSEYQADEDFSDCKTAIKAVAFYLPQFHESPYNNKFWGKGFTEWTNTRKATQKFPDHYQPREPHDDIGYYDLAIPSAMEKQARLAKSHGLYGFCFYYYWFSGERVLETPVDVLLANPQIDTNFMLCWANENWTRTWDGMENDVILSQKYSEDDPLNFIIDIAKYLLDPRYIRIKGSPVIMVYKIHLIKDVGKVFAVWKNYWKETYNEELIVWVNRTDPTDHDVSKLDAQFDGVVEFPPILIPQTFHQYPYLIDKKYLLNNLNVEGNFFDYRHLVSDIITKNELTPPPIGKKFYRSVMLGWDNSARREAGWSTWFGFSLDTYYAWLKYIVQFTKDNHEEDEQFLFINAWNEWAEGTYLEPDRKYGYASINTTSKAIFGRPLNDPPLLLKTTHDTAVTKKIAVHAHVFYENLAEELIGYLKNIPYEFDLFVTTDTEQKKIYLQSIFEQIGSQKALEVFIRPNIGRDIAPFIWLGSRLLQYDFVGHIHTKRSLTVSWGDAWREYLLRNMLGSPQTVSAVFETFVANPKLGLIYPENYSLIVPHIDWGGTKKLCSELLSSIGISMALPDDAVFPAGSFFWARVEAIKPLLEIKQNALSFAEEYGQVGGTLAHCIERSWCYVAAHQGYYSKSAYSKMKPQTAEINSKKRLALYVHFDPLNRVSDADLYYVKSLRDIAEDVLFVTNSDLSLAEMAKIKPFVNISLKRFNRGFDFAAWRDVIKFIGIDHMCNFDEVIFANNSCFGPLEPWDKMFSVMDNKKCDFWGITAFPFSPNSNRPEARDLIGRTIPEHLQSYFFVVRKDLVKSAAFFEFWDSVENKEQMMDVVSCYEAQMTKKFADAGFSYEVYVPESLWLQEGSDDPRFNATYHRPVDMYLCGSPVTKKRAVDYSPSEAAKLRHMVAAERLSIEIFGD